MATATPEEKQHNRSDLLICPVCLENMVERHPRSLRCLHTFCQSCLEQCEISVVNRCLECPLCKAETIIPEEGVKGLPLDFKLKQFSEILEEPSGSLDNCGNCLYKKKKMQASGFCKECELFLCKDCEHQHNNMFTGHMVTPRCSGEELTIRCESHSLVMKYYCFECKMCLCPLCMMTQKHSEHQDKTLPIDKAKVNVKSAVSTYIEELEGLNEKLQEHLQTKLAVSNSLSELAKKIHKKGLEQKKVIDDLVNTLINDLESNYSATVEKSVEAHQNIITSTNDMLLMLREFSVGEMMKAHQDVHDKIEVLQGKIETANAEVTNLIVPVFSSAQHIEWNLQGAEENKEDLRASDHLNGGMLKTKTDAKSEILPVNPPECSSRQTLKKCIQLTAANVDMKAPMDVAILKDNTILFSDTRLDHVTRLDQEGRVVRTYTPDKAANKIACMCTSGDTVFILHKVHLSTFVPKDNIPQFTTKHVGNFECDTVYSMAVDKYENLYIGNSLGQVFKIRAGTTMKKQVTYIGEDHDAIVNVADVGGREILIVCDDRMDRVFFIDILTGERLARIDGPFDRPNAATGTPWGTILIADRNNDRIAEYTLNGNCLGYPLTEDDGLISPIGIAYKDQYMWITECEPDDYHRSIKMYQYQ